MEEEMNFKIILVFGFKFIKALNSIFRAFMFMMKMIE
jgi:hypothetical protein